MSEDELLLEAAIHNRALKRMILAIILVLTGILLVAFSFMPIMAKSALPLIWVDYANEHGWTDELQEIGMRLLSDGRIEIIPMWVSYLAILIGGVFSWTGMKIFQNRHHPLLFGDAFTLGYWVNFYWLKKPISEVRVISYDKEIGKLKKASAPVLIKEPEREMEAEEAEEAKKRP